ncbi:MAG: hypothetical protein KF696_08865 [Planctomycetes bacterium]|nr:hypothetical protein [Planctomycetota bacterium]MCW8136709.1 hypothetical protein [Planctomycetota bacterium]
MRPLLLFLLLASPLCAQLKVGEDAPKFSAGGAMINPPEFARTLEDCKGDVIVIHEWHARDASAGKVPDLQKYWEKHGQNGLMIFTIHRLDFEKIAQVRKIALDRKFTLPICMGGFYDDKNDFFKYKDDGFRTTIIDIDGKVAFYSGKDDFKPVLDRELARIQYPNLGKHTATEAAAKVARGLQKREWGKCLADAEKLLAGELDDETKADLGQLQSRLEGFAQTRLKHIAEWTESRRYDLVMACLERMKDDFKGHKHGEDAKAEIARLKKDKDLKKELKAWEDYDKLRARHEAGEWQTYANALKAFAKAQAGTGAAVFAESDAKRIETEWEEANKK